MAQKKDKDNIEKVVVKARYWAQVVYPESAPSDWMDKIQMTGLPFVVSPLHDKDIDPTGEPKKAHYHVILCYGGPTTFSNVKKNISDYLGQPHPQYLQSVKGYYRYLTHQDNPDKYQYDAKDIKCFNGFNIQDYESFSISDEDRCFTALEDLIEQEQIEEYCDLIFYLKKNGQLELLSFIRRNTYHLKELIKSIRHSNYYQKQQFEVEKETGEIIEPTTTTEEPEIPPKND